MAGNLYLHFGDLPEAGRSVCWTLTRGTWDEGSWDELSDDRRAEFEAAGYEEIDGTIYEPGLSTFGMDVDCLPGDAELSFHVAGTDRGTVEDLLDRPVYLVSGEEVGAGFGGEPLVSGPAVVAEVELVRFDRRRGLLFVRKAEG